jgi:hypothetical protein
MKVKRGELLLPGSSERRLQQVVSQVPPAGAGSVRAALLAGISVNYVGCAKNLRYSLSKQRRPVNSRAIGRSMPAAPAAIVESAWAVLRAHPHTDSIRSEKNEYARLRTDTRWEQ